MKSEIILTLAVLSVIFLAGQGCEKQVACTEEAKLCPDGSAVGRVGPDCEFEACPPLPEDCGDAVTGFQDSCCAEKMKSAIHIQCVGEWKYIDGECKFECQTFGEPQSGLPNPASVKCERDGGSLEMINTPEGQVGYCVFEDNSICEEWSYHKGTCQKGECFKECGAIGTRSEGWYDSCTGDLIQWDNCGGE